MKYLIADTETNGLPVSFYAKASDVSNWPRIIQLAWELCDEKGNTIRKRCDLVKPDGWKVPTGKFWQGHGFTQAENEAKGLPMAELLESFLIAYSEADALICHNLSFDEPVISAEIIRAGLKVSRDGKIKKECTKLLSMDICKIPGLYAGQYKWPSLEEAHQFVFGKSFEGAHSADGDVQACKAVYLWIKDWVEFSDIL